MEENAIAVLEPAPEERKNGEELLRKLEEQSALRTAMARKQLQLTRLSTLFVGVMAAAVVLFVGLCLPRVNATLGYADGALQNLQAVTQQLQEADLAAILRNLDQTLTEGRVSLQDASEAMRNISAVDFEGLNKAITDLQKVLNNPIGSIFGFGK